MSCPTDPEMLSAYVDGLLSPSERDQVEQHLAECETCPPLLAALRDEAEALRSALAWGEPASMAPAVPRTRPWAVAGRIVAAAALVMATSLTTIWLDRLTTHGEPRGTLGQTIVRIAPGARAPRITVRVSRDDERWRIVPASFVVNRDGPRGGGEEDIDL